jgi:membrane protease YdiL (CAAX protease family)
MTTPPPPPPGFDPVTGQPLAPAPLAQPDAAQNQLIAPVWHTVLIVVMLVGNSAFSAIVSSRVVAHGGGAVTEKMRIVQYALTIVLELFLLFLVWIGLRLRQTRVRELIGGRWNTPEAFLIDVGIAAAYWVVAYLILAGLGLALGLAKASQVEEAKKLAEVLAPHTGTGLATFVLLSMVAGFVEEIIFRGYLQRQIGTLAGNIYVGLVVSALIFGASHGYEGTRRMILIFVFGMMFGLLALWRKSLRPGMMAHGWHDAFEGLILFFVARHGFPSMR